MCWAHDFYRQNMGQTLEGIPPQFSEGRNPVDIKQILSQVLQAFPSVL